MYDFPIKTPHSRAFIGIENGYRECHWGSIWDIMGIDPPVSSNIAEWNADFQVPGEKNPKVFLKMLELLRLQCVQNVGYGSHVGIA